MNKNITERFKTERLTVLAYELYREYIEMRIDNEELFEAYKHLEKIQEIYNYIDERKNKGEYIL